MANVFCAASGSNTAPYDTWAKAATSFATAIGAATTDGDTVVIQYDGVPATDAELAADTGYTVLASISLIASTNSGTSTITPTPMGVSNWIGNSTTNRSVTINGGGRVYMFGITLRTAGGTTDSINLATSDGLHYVLEHCFLWGGNTATASLIALGNASSGQNSYFHFKNTDVRLGHASQSINLRGQLLWEGGSLSSSGAAPNALISFNTNATTADIEGVDLSHLGTNPVFGNATGNSPVVELTRCTLGSGASAATILATQSTGNLSGATAWMFDCSDGDVHGLIGHANALGSTSSNLSIYFTGGAAVQSWKIETTANASQQAPYLSPWVDLYHATASAITPYLEILRDGSATAFQNDEVWGEFSAKTTANKTIASFYKDRMTFGGTPADQAAGAGVGSWTGENATAWSGKCDSGAAITPAEVGHIRGRICVAEPSTVVYVDPQIRY